MRFKNKKRLALAVAIATSAFLTGCGAQPAPAGNIPGGQAAGGCAPIGTGQIGFTATNILVDSSYVRGGQVPYQGTIGQILMTGAGTPPVATYPGAYGSPVQFGGQNVTGTTIQMTLSPTGTGSYPPAGALTGNAQGSGSLNLSPTAQQQLLAVASQGGYTYPYQSPYQNPYNPGAPAATACISQMAISMHHSVYPTGYGMYQLYMGSIYLYVNNTQRGLAIDF